MVVKRLPIINRSGPEVAENTVPKPLISEKPVNPACRQPKTTFSTEVGFSEAHHQFKASELPSEFDWRDVFGFNYVSWSTNEAVPHFCESCWAFAPSSALADRLMIQGKRSDITIALNPQSIINCKAGGTCSGGNPGEVYEFAHTHGIPDSSCFNYEGVDYPATCDPFDV